ncbi:unnamed protein product [Paramecium pentaurelia]|uniref:Uncharacterized protein n=1 Tax=Paramecium pentaurelia TaxID=43138 RepID=A0A8S1S5Q3_9CILI|nr:unnamed protein product [Paramecium pentaurelia]
MIIKSKSDCSLYCQQILAGCHQLTESDNQLQGDPIETLFFQNNTEWIYDASKNYTQNKNLRIRLYQQKVFSFRSDLKRMSTVIQVDQKGEKHYRLLVKGAPEALQLLFQEIPNQYEQCYQYYSNLGYRVLCLADREIKEYENQDREKLENNLVFRGFLICESPLKTSTQKYIQNIKQSYFQPIIITGENLLTTIAVSKQLQLHDNNKTYILDFFDNNYVFVEHGTNNKTVLNNVEQEIKLFQKGMLCISSTILEKLEDQHLIQLIIHFSIFARMSPKQKEKIVVQFKRQGKDILFCGDGKKDVGALEKADVGIALIRDAEMKYKKLSLNEQLNQLFKKKENLKKQKSKASSNFNGVFMAVPFICKMQKSIKCVNTILIQGVYTLVFTIQMYKIMALYSILNAYSFSALHMQSLKMSQTQMIFMSILGVTYYYCYTSATQLKRLSKIKPSFSIFEYSFFISLTLQIILHISSMYYAIYYIAIPNMTVIEKEIKNQTEFQATFLNTTVFLLLLLQQSCIVLFNYPGEPHMQNINMKSKLFKSLFIPLVLCIISALNYSEFLNYCLELTFPQNKEPCMQFIKLCLFVIIMNWIIEKVIKTLKYKKCYGFL